jgi:hypothetical protein
MSDFVVGGVVPRSSDAYVSRAFEQQVFGHLSAGDWVTLLGPRQHGKTSGLIRVRAQLGVEGFAVGFLDLSTFIPPVDGDAWGAFLAWMESSVRKSFGLSEREIVGGPDLVSVLSLAMEGAGPTPVLMLDEAAGLPPEIGQLFFAQLRSIHTAQRSESAPDPVSRLGMLFAGTFRPDTMIDDDNSPFNVSRIVHTDDLSEDDVAALAENVGGSELATWAGRVYNEVGGQPYLVQYLFDSISSVDTTHREQVLSAAMANISSGADGHLPGLLRRVGREPGADELLARMVGAGDGGVLTSGDGLATFLVTVGIAKVKGDLRLVPRNGLYERALAASPSYNPDAFIRVSEGDVPDGSAGTIALLSKDELAWIKNDRLREVVSDLHGGAVAAAEMRKFRMAVAGLGAAYEGMILALVGQIDEAERDRIRKTVQTARGDHPSLNPDKCTFEGLVLIAHASGQLPNLPVDASHIARDWRNLIHPGKATRQFQSESSLQPEAQILAALIVKLVQHLR